MNWIDDSEPGDPLNRIRQVEAEAASHLRAAQEASELKLKQARERAQELRQKALELGTREGQRDGEERMIAAQAGAQRIIATAHECARRYEHIVQDETERLIDGALAIVTGLTQNGEQP